MAYLRALVLVSCLVCLASAATDRVFMPPSVQMEHPDHMFRNFYSKVNFLCAASGSPRPTMRWFLNDTLIKDSGRFDFLMSQANIGYYQCKAENQFGIAESNYTWLDMAYLNDFPDIPSNENEIGVTSVKEGDHLKLKCSYTDPFSKPRPNWRWVTQDVPSGTFPKQENVDLLGRLSVDDRGNLYFQHVLRTDNRDNWFHLCSAHNGIMNVNKIGSPYKLVITPNDNIAMLAPSLVYQNGNPAGTIELIEGENLDMYCIFKGYPEVLIKWEKLGNTPQPDKIYYNGNTFLRISKVQNNNKYEGKYQCKGYQKGRTAFAIGTFTVNILSKPKFIEGPVNTNVTEGGSVTFRCRAQAEPTAQVEWFVNGLGIQELPYDARREVNGNVIKFSKLRRGTNSKDSDLMVVSCKASNHRSSGGELIGRSIMTGYVNVLLAMKFVTPPENHTISDSSLNVVLDCEISSDPSKTPHVSWHRNQAPIHLKKERYEMAPNNSLIIFVRNFDDLEEVKGEYMCVGQTRAPAQELSHKAWVDVKAGVVPVAPIATASINLWWIGLILVLIILLLILLLICCLIKRNKGESYPVDEVERKMGNDPEKDLIDQGFHDYQRKEKNPIGGSRASLDSSIKPLDSDDDSMLEYGDIDPGKFNEDGSFIGQYANYDRKQADTNV